MIKVWNDGKLVFEGEAKAHIEMNEFNEEVVLQVVEALEYGMSIKEIYPSGIWKVKKV